MIKSINRDKSDREDDLDCSKFLKQQRIFFKWYKQRYSREFGVEGASMLLIDGN